MAVVLNHVNVPDMVMRYASRWPDPDQIDRESAPRDNYTTRR